MEVVGVQGLGRALAQVEEVPLPLRVDPDDVDELGGDRIPVPVTEEGLIGRHGDDRPRLGLGEPLLGVAQEDLAPDGLGDQVLHLRDVVDHLIALCTASRTILL